MMVAGRSNCRDRLGNDDGEAGDKGTARMADPFSFMALSQSGPNIKGGELYNPAPPRGPQPRSPGRHKNEGGVGLGQMLKALVKALFG